MSNNIKESFNIRSSFFHNESTWSVSENLNNHCIEILTDKISTQGSRILDYGSGPGILSKELNSFGYKVDVADISKKMLEKCDFAENRYLLPKDKIVIKYDRIILRQVLQYVQEDEWTQFLLKLKGLLKESGMILFSQIVPYCNYDYSFWKKLVSIRRPERKSFPTENEVLKLVSELNLRVCNFSYCYTMQSMNDWIRNANNQIKNDINKQFSNSSNPIRALWKINTDKNDITWQNKWVNILIF